MGRHVDFQEVIEALTLEGVAEEDYYLVANPETGYELIEFWLPELGPRMRLMDDGDLANACKEYLRAKGVRRFSSSPKFALRI